MKKLSTLILILTVLLVPCLCAAADSWDLYLPESLTEIEESAFAGDTSLNRVYVDDTVEVIGSQAFANSSLRDIRLPDSLTEIAPDAFLNVPHVEVYGTWDPNLLDGMDNVAMSGTELPANETTNVPVAPGQEVFRKVSVDMTGTWYFGVQNCSSAELYNADGDKIVDLEFGEFAYFTYHAFTKAEDVYLCIRNDTDALITASVYIEAPYQVMGLVSIRQAETKGSLSVVDLYYPAPDFNLSKLEPNQFYAPSIRTTFKGETADFLINLYVDDIHVGQWEGTFTAPDDETTDFLLGPTEAMWFNGFEEGEHTVRIEANGAVTEYTYAVSGERALQSIGPEASSLFILPDQHIYASFTPDSDGVYNFLTDIPVKLSIFGRLFDEDGNILDSKEETTESYDFNLSAKLTKGQTVYLEAWLDSQEEIAKPFYGVVTLVVNDPYAEGRDIFKDAQCRALVIGQTYATAPESISRLTGCETDANAMARMLTSLGGSPFAVSEYLNLDASEILDAIPLTFAGATGSDISLFYYSGHGAGGSGSLVGNDGEGVTPEQLKAALDKVPGTKIVLLDSCYSGYFIGRGEDDGAQAAEALEHFRSVFNSSSNAGGAYYVLTASSMYETSIGYEDSSSLFTYFLLLGMGYDADDNASWTGKTPADANQDGMYTLDELYVYCRDHVRDTKIGQTVCPSPYGSGQVIFIDEVPEQ